LVVVGAPHPAEQADRAHEASEQSVGTPALRIEPWQHRHEIDRMRLCVGDERAQRARVEHHVGIAEEHPLAGREREPAFHRVELAQPPRGQLTDMHDLEPPVGTGQAVEDLPSGVGGAIVDRDHLQIGIAARELRVNSRCDVVRFVLGRDHDGELRPARWRGIVKGRDGRQRSRTADNEEQDHAPVDNRDERQHGPPTHSSAILP
jgi:hypothetical protein